MGHDHSRPLSEIRQWENIFNARWNAIFTWELPRVMEWPNDYPNSKCRIELLTVKERRGRKRKTSYATILPLWQETNLATWRRRQINERKEREKKIKEKEMKEKQTDDAGAVSHRKRAGNPLPLSPPQTLRKPAIISVPTRFYEAPSDSFTRTRALPPRRLLPWRECKSSNAELSAERGRAGWGPLQLARRVCKGNEQEEEMWKYDNITRCMESKSQKKVQGRTMEVSTNPFTSSAKRFKGDRCQLP